MNSASRALTAGVLAGALAILAGCSPGQPVPSGTPSAGQPSATTSAQPTPSQPGSGLRVVPLASVPDVHVPDQLDVVAGTGTRFLIAPGWNGGQGRYTPDSGRTWFTLAEVGAFDEVYGGVLGYQGTFIRLRMSEDEDPFWSGFQIWDPNTAGITDLLYDLSPDIPEEDGDWDIGVELADYIGTLVLLADSRIFDISGAQALPVEPRLPDGVQLENVVWTGLTRDGRHVAGHTAARDRLVVGALDETGNPAAIKVPGLMAVDVSADRVHYLVSSASRVQVCKADAATPAKAGCVTVTNGDYRASRYYGELSTSDGADQVLLGNRDTQDEQGWFVRQNRATRVWSVSSSDSAFWRWLPFRDTARPLALATQSPGGPDQVVAFANDASTSPLFAAPAATARASEIRPTPDRVVYQQRRVSPQGDTRWFVWQRALIDGQLGPETLFADTESYHYRVSGDRTVVDVPGEKKDTNKLVFHDGERQTAAVDPGSTISVPWALSGPYAWLWGRGTTHQVVRADGHGFDTKKVMRIFGSLVIEASASQETVGRTFTIRDLERPGAEPVLLDLLGAAERVYRNDNWFFWGDWVVAAYEDAPRYVELLFNHRTGETVVLPESRRVIGLGDGWALLIGYDGVERTLLRSLATGEEVVLGEDWSEVGSDGGRMIAWASGEGTFVGRIEGLPDRVPRLLGSLGAATFRADGKASWTPEFDLTAPNGPGTLRVTDAAGAEVVALPVAATATGSIRGLAWDGRTLAGELAEPGEYTWALDVDGALSVDGQRPASGVLVVTR